MANEPLLQVEDVSYSYKINSKETLQVLTDVSFSVQKGEYVAIIGHNGSGKSTLSKLLNGILVPEKGQVRVKNLLTSDRTQIKEIRRTVGMVFQHPDNQIVATIVEDDIAFGLENIGVPHDEMDARITGALEAVGMSEYRYRPPHHLSGGQKQRVAIAGILAMQPECLVLDEATSMLDSYGRDDVLAIMRKLHENGMTIITVTHHMNEVIEADRVIVIAEGKIAMVGSPREIFMRQQELESLHLDVPDCSRIAKVLHQEVSSFNATAMNPEEIVSEVKRLTHVNQEESKS
ncbi:energy-coupling factor transporter ATPase [Brevibacillus daliensis]|uniref:energy-coupling factor transporter ATPase n=1 Tax=Brevibacillus daliensis TaxID=2892995 RepID=UPI001E636571|nr:energy-coupling factor transporter ATPase [Brevibacillus daliensis]